MELAEAKRKFNAQRQSAKKRGIPWELTFAQWYDWWGKDLDRRGRGVDKLQMQRPCDQGPYALGNIRKGTLLDNIRTRTAMGRNRVAAITVAQWSAFRESADDDPDDRPEANELGYRSVWSDAA